MKKILFSLLMLCCMTAAVAGPVPGGYTAKDYSELKAAVTNSLSADGKTSNAKITLTADIYLKDEGELCSIFTGTLDGNGYTIYAGDANAHHDGRGLGHGKYLFVHSEGATFKNLTFKDFRADTDEHFYWAILTSQAKNGCVFENITFDHVSVWSAKSECGFAAGYAQNCTFTNITVKNSDITVDNKIAGAVVGNADKCTFTNIIVDSSESTAHTNEAGGVVGHSNTCTFTNVNIKNCFIKAYDENAGGIAANSQFSHYTNCNVDDQSCVCANGTISRDYAHAGGITGESGKDELYNCINSALIAGDDNYVGGIAGRVHSNTIIDNCLNTGLVVSIDIDDVMDDDNGDKGYYSKYKNKLLPCETKYYKGKAYVVRKTDLGNTQDHYFGGIVGGVTSSTISKCANIGSMVEEGECGGLVGTAVDATISDCFCNFSAPSGVYAILGGSYTSSSKIINCVNATNNTNYGVDSNVELRNLFTSTFDSQTLASGMACILLGAAWEQNVGVDPYPTPTVTVLPDNEYDNPAKYYSYEYLSTTGSVVIKRTFDNDGWYSLCLPFDVDATQTAEKFAQVAEFSELDGNTNTYKFTTVDHIEAGKPYIVRVDTKLENPKFSSVTIAANVEADNSGAFVGVLKPTEVKSGDLAIGSGTTVNPMHEGTMKAFRAYFPQTSANATKAMRFTVDDGEATSIELMQNAEPKEGGQRESQCRMQNYYNLSGQKVDENYRGIVIKNGKKVVKK